MKTSIVLPWIRPEKVLRCAKLIHENVGIPKSHYEVVAEEDVSRIGCPKMVKGLVDRSSFETIMFLGDDTLPQENFLLNAQNAMEKFEGSWGLVGLNDKTGRTGLPTHWLGHKKLLDFLDGEFFHTGYSHCCCDVELAERCSAIGRYSYSLDAIVLHDHPLLKGEPLNDPDYERVYSASVLGPDRKLLVERRNKGWP